MTKKYFYAALLSWALALSADAVFARNGGGLWWDLRKTIAYDPADVDPLAHGDGIPYGTLRSIGGKAVDLEGLLNRKNTILLFYQGGWSTSANLQLDQLNEAAPVLLRMGFQIIAVSPDRPSQLRKSSGLHNLRYPLFCDRTMEVTRRFGVAYRADSTQFEEAGVHLSDYTGHSNFVLPVPAVFGIGPKGIIQFSYFNSDPRETLDIQGLLRSAKGMLAASNDDGKEKTQ